MKRELLMALICACLFGANAKAYDMTWNRCLYRDVQIYFSRADIIACRSRDGNFTVPRESAPAELLERDALRRRGLAEGAGERPPWKHAQASGRASEPESPATGSSADPLASGADYPSQRGLEQPPADNQSQTPSNKSRSRLIQWGLVAAVLITLVPCNVYKFG